MSQVRLTLLGTPSISFEGQTFEVSVKKATALLAFLAVTAKPQTRERIATLLWQDSTEDVARTSLRQALRALRETPLASVLLTTREAVSLEPDFTSDVHEFRQHNLYDTSDTSNILSLTDRSGDPLTLETLAHLQAAAALYQGEFMQGFHISGSTEWDDWLQFQRIEFQYQAIRVFSVLARYYAKRRLVDSGLQMARRWLDLDPQSEEGYRLIMYFYALDNQNERALEHYHALARMLKREHGRSPDPETHRLYEQLRLGQRFDPELQVLSKKSMRTLLPNPIFMAPGYDAEYTQIKQALGGINSGKTARLIVVYDALGSSAATLISRLAHDPGVQAQFGDGILWGALENDADLDSVLRLWMDALRVSILKNTRKPEHLIWQLHNGMRGKCILLLLENLQDARYGRLLTPGYAQCTLLISTRQRQTAHDLAAFTDHLVMFPMTTPNKRVR